MFFVHQRGTMNGIYLLMVAVGVSFFSHILYKFFSDNTKSFLAPVASGGIALTQGWRWMYWWTTILLGINVFLFLFFYEETKFIPRDQGEGSNEDSTRTNSASSKRQSGEKFEISPPPPLVPGPPTNINTNIPMKSRRERLAFVTTSKAPFSKLFRHTWHPFVILATIPSISYCAVQYGILLSWFSVIVTSEAQFFVLPPYNFDEVGIGLLCMPAFIGCVFGFAWGGPFSDWSILWLTRRNKGVYEPEFRLYGAILPAVLGPVGLFVYGYGTASVSYFLSTVIALINLWYFIGIALDRTLYWHRSFRFRCYIVRRYQSNLPVRFIPRDLG